MNFKKIKKKIRFLSLHFLNLSNFRFKNPVSQKEIVIVFDGKIPHGGFADRLKGIFSFYNIANLSDAKFKIFYSSPFNLKDFFEPNLQNWEANANDLKWNFKSTKFIYLMDVFSFDWKKEIQKSPKNKFIVYCNIDYLSNLYPTKSTKDLNLIRSQNFNNLFKQSNYLQTSITQVNLPESYIAIHTRFTSILGDFKDTTSHIISQNRKAEIIASLTSEIDKISNQHKHKPIFVFSDSIIFLNHIRENTKYNILDGMPKHIDLKSKANTESNLKNFIDFIAISKGDEIYLLQTKEMYNSAFSKYAGIIANKNINNIILD
jgi:hypothetical protein